MDLRLPKLYAEIDPFLDRMRGLMTAQEKKTPVRLSDPESILLGDSLKQACCRFSELGLPDTLGHLDFNPGNIIISAERCLFMDWAEACLTNPLVTFEYLREHFRRKRADDPAAVENLVAAYMGPWESLAPMNRMKQASAFSPLVAVFACAVGAAARRSPDSSGQSSERAYLRSLARRMFRESGQIAARSEPCLA